MFELLTMLTQIILVSVCAWLGVLCWEQWREWRKRRHARLFWLEVNKYKPNRWRRER